MQLLNLTSHEVSEEILKKYVYVNKVDGSVIQGRVESFALASNPNGLGGEHLPVGLYINDKTYVDFSRINNIEIFDNRDE